MALFLLALGAARTHADSLTVMWNPNPEPDVVGYLVYVGTQPGVHMQVHDVGNTTAFVFRDGVPGQLYYFAIAAYTPGPILGAKSAEVSGSISAAPDAEAPTVAITAPTSASSFVSALPSLTLAGTATDNVGVTAVTWTTDRGHSGTASGTTAWTASGIPLAVGANQITVGAHDAAGNRGTAVVSVTYIDSEAPTLKITSPTSASSFTVTTPSLTLGGTATDNVGVTAVTWATDRGEAGTAAGTTNWTAANIPLTTGLTTITVVAHDAAGNTVSAVVKVTYAADHEAPVVTLLSPTTAAMFSTSTTSVTLAGTATDNVGVVSVSWVTDSGLSGAAAGTASWNTGAIALQPGETRIVVSAYDFAGNHGSTTLTVTMTPEADAIAPAVSITSPRGRKHNTTGDSALIAGVAVDNVGVTAVTWTNDRGGSGIADGTSVWSVDVPLQEGDNTIVVTAHDAAGNSAEAVVIVERKRQTGGTGRR